MHKNLKVLLLVLAATVLLFGYTAKAMVPATATVKITISAQNGKRLTGVQITCTDKGPSQTNENGVPIPSAPKFTYLTSSNGSATWTVSVESGHTYSCTPRTGVAYIGGICYSLSGGASGFSLSPGQTKYITIKANLAPGHCTYYGEKTYSKTKKSTVQYAPVAKIKFPSTFTAKGSATSKLAKLTVKQAKNYKNFTLDNVKYGKIVFKEAVDLSSKDIANKFKNLDKYVKMVHGQIFLDSSQLKQLNKKAQLYFYGMNLNQEFEILIAKNNKIDKEISKTAKYDINKHTLTIEVNGFSTYTYVPQIKITSATSTNTIEYTLTGKISDKDATVNIYLNGNQIAKQIKPNENGEFSYKLQLNEGTNTIEVKATGIDTSSTSQNVEVKLPKEAALNTNNIPWLLVIAGFSGVIASAGILYSRFLKNKPTICST